MNHSGNYLLSLCLALALIGAALCASLTSAHLSGGDGLLAVNCGDATSACGRVLSSRWSVFPPAAPGDVADGAVRSGVPVAGLGLLYFSTLAVWLALVGVCRGSRARWNTVALQCMGAGCAVSLLYAAIMVTQIDAFCPLCLGAHAANLVLLASFYGVVRGQGQGAGRSGAADVADQPEPRLALASLTLGPCLGALLWVALDAQAGRTALQAQADRLAHLDSQAGLVELAYFADTRFSSSDPARQRFDATLRPDDPELPASDGANMTLVLYSDAECPSCGRFERLLLDDILPLFGGHLRVVYKYFPLTIHPAAEPAARALEAARQQGAFWSYKALLDEQRERLDEVDHAALAGALGLDIPRFLADWSSPAAVLRVAEDIAAGKSLGVDGTPTVFLNRRLVDPLTRSLLGFWSRRAQALREARESRDESW